MDRPLYVPRYIARCTTVNNPSGARLASIVSYDYMGAAEYEFGAIPGSLAVFRLAIFDNLASTKGESDGLHLFEHTDERLVSKAGPYKGKRLYSLMLRKNANVDFIAAYEEALVRLSTTSRECKEPTHFDRAFKEDKYGNHTSATFDLWHDIKNHLFFSHSEELLVLVRAHLTCNIEIASPNDLSKWCNKPDTVVEFIDPKPGKINTHHDVSAENWKRKKGTMVSFSDTTFSVQCTDGNLYTVGFNMLITCPVESRQNISREKLVDYADRAR